MPVDEGTRTVSLSELESIFITLRFMDADQVYQSKQVLVMIDVKCCLYYQPTTLVCIIEPRTLLRRPEKKCRVREDHKGGKQRTVKMWCRIILSPHALACHSTHFDQKGICPNAFTTKLEIMKMHVHTGTEMLRNIARPMQSICVHPQGNECYIRR